jgi:hypothetical protein
MNHLSEQLKNDPGLADRMNQIEQQIKMKRQLLLEKRKYLEENVKENNFLENVRNDYKKYHNFILKQKQDQIKSMQFLNQYIDDLMISGKLTEHDIVNSKKEKQGIII